MTRELSSTVAIVLMAALLVAGSRTSEAAELKFEVLHHFTGATETTTPRAPYASPVAVDGVLYGTTVDSGSRLGSVYRREVDGTLTILSRFDGLSDGSQPFGGLARGADGELYGTTQSGVSFGTDPAPYGTVFRVSRAGMRTTLHRFKYSDGAHPIATLTSGDDGYLYGTTSTGGYGAGVVFRIDPSAPPGSGLTVLHRFEAQQRDGVWQPDGAHPYGGVVKGADGALYGTTAQGGPDGAGTVYRLAPDGTLTRLHSFNWNDGANSVGPLTFGSDGLIYGTAAFSAWGTYGTVFRLDTAGDNFTVLHSFTNYADGAHPHHGLLVGIDGALYGTTVEGGAAGYGTVFKIDPTTGTRTTLHSFSGSDGAGPCCFDRLRMGPAGEMYGTTVNGGADDLGVIFRVSTAGMATQLAVSGAGVYGDTATLTATLTAAGGSAAGKSVAFSLNGDQVGSATTAANGVATLTGISLAGVNAGTYPGVVTATFGAADGYLGSSAQGDLTISKATQGIIFAGAPSTATVGTTFSVTASATSGLAVTVAASGACSINAMTVTINTPTGVCSLKADQAGDANYNAAPQATLTTAANFDFKGFFWPVDNPPALNRVRAGSYVPVRFSLAGDHTLAILDGTPASTPIACGDEAVDSAIEESPATSWSGLRYLAFADQYLYVWKTERAWAGTCRELILKLADGTLHRANFMLK